MVHAGQVHAACCGRPDGITTAALVVNSASCQARSRPLLNCNGKVEATPVESPLPAASMVLLQVGYGRIWHYAGWI